MAKKAGGWFKNLIFLLYVANILIWLNLLRLGMQGLLAPFLDFGIDFLSRNYIP